MKFFFLNFKKYIFFYSFPKPQGTKLLRPKGPKHNKQPPSSLKIDQIQTPHITKHTPLSLSHHQNSKMGQAPSGGLNRPGGDRKSDDANKKEKKYEPAAPPSRVGRKQRKQKGPEAAGRLPAVTPLSKCRLRLLKLERIKDYLLMEEEFVANQERLKPQEEKNEEDRSKVDDLRGSPMSVGNLEELIDENHAIVSSSVGPEYYVGILSFVDKDQLEPGCAILMHNKVFSSFYFVLGFLFLV